MSQQAVQQSIEDVWYLKTIEFGDGESRQRRKIITQNFNGPCSFIAICNILILRGDIEIQPPERTSVSYEFMSQLVGEYLLLHCPDVDISAALSIMPRTTKGMDLNPLFTSHTSFRPAGSDTSGGELQLFDQAGIKLVHGWLVDPDSPEHPAVAKTEDYDTSVNLVVEADHLTKGRLVTTEADYLSEAGPSSSSAGAGSSAGPSSPGYQLSEHDDQKVRDAIAVRGFLDKTSSQLTYYGLFTLASSLRPGSLVALFRNSHLSVLYKSPSPEDAALYTLVTDYAFLHEPTVVWERLEDVEGHSATFVDSDFRRSSPAGGDFAGETGESTLAALERSMADLNVDPADQALAAQLQAEEDARAQDMYRRREEARAERQRKADEEAAKREAKALKKKPSCIIM
ncbi:hypothetical protein PUNSTDRAFT_55772 [Punctularia strigosozonata HHB-11173 SS5]|uniref:MINDY deubiquitinase domain-containing protein n=1 Tax=Punctularia strigosozonata (strain HHB-11173) TaxID=741275 RepID=R7S0I9_PUNST|nr:uncharacterized protein PUNSTDRAFT_55772 [Punctularia strigosozonata HHB-11173 SS5]EIN03915.1 hypothetical protein PUNSTDRAFT_55772 [Punctularia strigosozonata HHB-11173 SS5]